MTSEAEQAAQICEEMARDLWIDEATPLVMRQYSAGVLKLAAAIIRERVTPRSMTDNPADFERLERLVRLADSVIRQAPFDVGERWRRAYSEHLTDKCLAGASPSPTTED